MVRAPVSVLGPISLPREIKEPNAATRPVRFNVVAKSVGDIGFLGKGSGATILVMKTWRKIIFIQPLITRFFAITCCPCRISALLSLLYHSRTGPQKKSGWSCSSRREHWYTLDRFYNPVMDVHCDVFVKQALRNRQRARNG